MTISTSIDETVFSASLKCATKAYLLATGETASSSHFVDAEACIVEAYKNRVIRHFRGASLRVEPIAFSEVRRDLGSHGIAYYVDSNTVAYGCQPKPEIEDRDAFQAAPGHDYVPVLYSAWNKPQPSDNLLLCFCALAISQVIGMLPEAGKLIYGEGQRSKTVKISEYVVRTQQLIDTIRSTCGSQQPPRLILNKHCAICDFQSRCRNASIEHDDLSLLTAMNSKERAKLNEKGIFTITQLSYGYRPRRRKRVRSETTRSSHPTKYDPKLKALAIKKAQIHVVNTPSVKIQGNPVFLDVEGMPDRDFYYLIGLRFERAGEHVERTFWADGPGDELAIWKNLLQTLGTIENPQIIHYGAYDIRFLRQMSKKYQQTAEEEEFIDHLVDTSLNLVNCIYGKIYFPTYSNSLKEIGRYLGFEWTWPQASGGAAVLLRRQWELVGDAETKRELLTYNMEDCRAAETVTKALVRICDGGGAEGAPGLDAVDVSSLEVGFRHTFGKFASVLPEFEKINSAAYWDYQRSKVYVRTNKTIRRSVKKSEKTSKHVAVEKEVRVDDRPEFCPKCHSKKLWAPLNLSHLVFDLKFMRQGIKRWVTRYHYNSYRCCECLANMTPYSRDWQYGPNLCAYVIYLLIEMRLSNQKISDHIASLFDLPVRKCTANYIKSSMAKKFEPTYQRILEEIAQGSLVHADETKGVVKGGGHYLWVFTNLTSVAYVYAESREAAILEDLLKGFSGVLVSDFYAAYDSVPCAQQKCLIHLMRDINEDMLKNPFNEELATIARGFGALLREIVETVDTYGLKARHLGKHKRRAASFIEDTAALECTTEVGLALKKRIEKNKDKLFTFLDHDNVPWNNNNAEHAVRGFARLRNVMMTSTPKGTHEYAVLLSIQQTLQYRGMGFLDFLRSGRIEI
jgi:predicted RecB family nuclease